MPTDVKIIQLVGVPEDGIRRAVHNSRVYPFHCFTCAVFGIEPARRRYRLR
jgi:hypothetical protein